ncbi:hypothetical protein FRC07_011119, partial [Ceratobasidium sp. 392]
MPADHKSSTEYTAPQKPRSPLDGLLLHLTRVRKHLRIVTKQSVGRSTKSTPHDDPWPHFLQEYHNQVAIWSHLNHQNVVRVFGQSDSWSFEVEYCENGCVRDYLKSHIGVDKLAMIRDVLDGLKYLHALPSPVIHGNLNAGKLFVTSDGTTKIGEFGLAALCHPIAALVPSVNLTGLSRWLSPELLTYEEDTVIPTKASDVWAILSETLPYSQYKHDIKVQEQILNGSPPGRRNDASNISWLHFIWPLLEACWTFSPDARPTVTKLSYQLEEFLEENVARSPYKPDILEASDGTSYQIQNYTTRAKSIPL